MEFRLESEGPKTIQSVRSSNESSRFRKNLEDSQAKRIHSRSKNSIKRRLTTSSMCTISGTQIIGVKPRKSRETTKIVSKIEEMGVGRESSPN